MSFIQRKTVTVTTDASGDATSYSAALTGKIRNIIYTKDDYDAGVDFAITLESTGQNVWSENNVDASKTVAPVQPSYDPDGNQIINSLTGDPVAAPIAMADDRVQIVVSNGGNAKAGQFIIVVE